MAVNASQMATPSTILLGSHKHQFMCLLHFYCAQSEILRVISIKLFFFYLSYYSDTAIFKLIS